MKNAGRVLGGLCVIAAAVVIVLSQMGLLSVEFSIAQIILGILAVAILAGALADRSFGGVFVSLGLVWIGFGEMMGLPHVSIWVVILCIVLLSIGFEILFPHHKHKNKKKNDEDGFHNNERQQITNDEKDGFIMCSNRFGSLAKYITATDLVKAELTNSFGEMKVYFDQTQISAQGAEIRVNNSFGEMQLFIPKGWNVKSDVSVFAGECNTYRAYEEVGGPSIHLVGSVSFGEIQIHYV